MRRTLFGMLTILVLAGCSAATNKPALAPDAAATAGAEPAGAQEQAGTVEDVIPLTMGNLRGHQMLYDEGWFVVTSSRRALAYAREHALTTSGKAVQRAARKAGADTARFGKDVATDVKDAAKGGARLVTTGTEITGTVLEGTHELAKKELAYAGERFGKAMDAFITGNITLAKRTEADRRELAELPGEYYRDLAGDFSNLHELTGKVRQSFSGKIDASWEHAFARASTEFRGEYERSGQAPNTLAALGPVLTGWLKAFYHGLAAPAAKTVVKTTVAGTTYAVFLPVAGTAIVTGRTVQAVGLTVYYTGKTGIKVISPTVEGGLLASMSLLSAASVPATYAGGAAVGAVNQVAFTAAGPVYAAVDATASTAVDTAVYVALVTYDAAAGATTVAFNQAASAVVLGYNALTAIPTHTLLAAGDAAIFLAWDGPRLAIAAARGELGSKDGGSAALQDLPVGTVVDLEKLRSAPGAQVEVLSTDEKVIKDVLERLPEDLREKENDK